MYSMNNDHHAITKDFLSMTEPKQLRMIELTQCIMDYQSRESCHILHPCQVSSSTMTDIYMKYSLFTEIKKYMDKTTPIRKMPAGLSLKS